VDPLEFNPNKHREICKSVLEIMKIVYDKGVYCMSVDFGNFLLSANGHTPRMHSFPFAFSVEELQPGQFERLPRVNREGMK
jgi:hypothetical protein